MSKFESASSVLYRVALLGVLLMAAGESHAQYTPHSENWAQLERSAREKLKRAEKIVETYPQDSTTYREASQSLPGLRHGVQWAMDGHNQELRSRPREATYSKPQSSGYANYGANGYDYDEGLGRPTTSSRTASAATVSSSVAPVYPVDDGISNAAPFSTQNKPSKAVGMFRVASSSLSDDYILHIFPERPENMKANRELLWRELSRLENKLAESALTDEAREKAVLAFKERNIWYGRYEQAIAARELVMARNGLVNRPEGSRLKRLTAKEALGLVSKSESADKNLKRGLELALKKSTDGSLLKKMGFLAGRAKGAGLVGVVGAVVGAAASGAVVAGETESLAMDEAVAPATFSRSEFRPEARRRVSR